MLRAARAEGKRPDQSAYRLRPFQDWRGKGVRRTRSRQDDLSTSLRFAEVLVACQTACGLDLVLNDFVACAIASGEITVLSDGTPWRPLIDVEDMARAISWAIVRSSAGKTGASSSRSTPAATRATIPGARTRSEAVARQVSGTKVSINTNAPPDKRSYKVDFSLFKSLACPDSIPQVTLDEIEIRRLREGLTAMGFADKDFRNSQYMRLKIAERHTWPPAALAPICALASSRADRSPRRLRSRFRRMKFLKHAAGRRLHDPRSKSAQVTSVAFSRALLLREGIRRRRVAETRFVQINNSLTGTKGTLRGLHYQLPPAAEVKVVRAVKGALWDVIVDLRPGSSTHLKWFGAELNEDNRRMMYVPRGFGHGFVTLTDNAEALYLVSAAYSPETERGVRWNDPAIGIEWPFEPRETSEKDRNWPDFDAKFHGLEAMRGLA